MLHLKRLGRGAGGSQFVAVPVLSFCFVILYLMQGKDVQQRLSTRMVPWSWIGHLWALRCCVFRQISRRLQLFMPRWVKEMEEWGSEWKKEKKESMNEWRKEGAKEWMNERMNEWMNEWDAGWAQNSSYTFTVAIYFLHTSINRTP